MPSPKQIYSFPTRRRHLDSDEAAYSFPPPASKPTGSRRTLCGIDIRILGLIAFLIFAVFGLAIVSGVEGVRVSSYSKGPTCDFGNINSPSSISTSISMSKSFMSISSGSTQVSTTSVPPSNTVTSGASAPTATPATDGGCKGPNYSANGTFYQTYNSERFQIFCSIDYPGVSNMLGVISPSFEACMEACGSWNNLILESNAIPCSGVVFILGWYNATGHVAREEAAACFLKKDLKSTSQLVINTGYETDVAFKI